MGNNKLNTQIKTATKWSTITEIAAKLVAPISTMVLARLLTPEAFGVVATLTMIISFAEIFTDAGFQKYLIQHEFENKEDQIKCTNVAFWSNLTMSFVIWGVIAAFCEPLATLVGNPGLGYVIAIACVSIPLAAFSSIQMALYKRDFDFKTLFKVRIAGIIIPLLITIPLALYFRNFWALLLGTIAKDIANAFLLTYFSKWKPKLFFSMTKLKEMLSFTIWSMVEQVSIWLTGYMDIFIVGVMLNAFYLGVYRTSITTVGQIIGLITAATTPVLFASLSRLQNNRDEFEAMFFKFQKWVGLLVLPLGAGIFCYSDLVTAILLGAQWTEASGFIGLWGLTSAVTIVLSHYCSEIYRSLGKPKLSVLAQWLHIIVLLPTVYIAVQYGYETLFIARSLVRFELIAVNLAITYWLIKLSPIKMLKNIFPEIIGCCAVIICYYTFNIFSSNLSIDIISAIMATILYFAIVSIFKAERDVIMSNIKRLKIIK